MHATSVPISGWQSVAVYVGVVVCVVVRIVCELGVSKKGYFRVFIMMKQIGPIRFVNSRTLMGCTDPQATSATLC